MPKQKSKADYSFEIKEERGIKLSVREARVKVIALLENHPKRKALCNIRAFSIYQIVLSSQRER
jgi:hypothetical protein